jgi:hypothetical protein
VPSLNAGSIKLTPVQTGTVTVTVTLTDDGGTDFGGQNTAEYTFAAEVFETVNVEDNFANEINIYPNPSEDIFHIAVPAELADYEIRVTDQSGKILLRNRIQKQDDEHRLNLSDYQSGVYFITLISETNSYKKIIIKK